MTTGDPSSHKQAKKIKGKPMKIFIVVLFAIGLSCITFSIIMRNRTATEGPKISKPIRRYGIEHVHISQVKPPAQSVKREKEAETGTETAQK